VLAHVWLTRSADGGFERVKPMLAQLDTLLSPTERARAKQLLEQPLAAQ
jgi:hypothetical protein